MSSFEHGNNAYQQEYDEEFENYVLRSKTIKWYQNRVLITI